MAERTALALQLERLEVMIGNQNKKVKKWYFGGVGSIGFPISKCVRAKSTVKEMTIPLNFRTFWKWVMKFFRLLWGLEEEEEARSPFLLRHCITFYGKILSQVFGKNAFFLAPKKNQRKCKIVTFDLIAPSKRLRKQLTFRCQSKAFYKIKGIKIH